VREVSEVVTDIKAYFLNYFTKVWPFYYNGQWDNHYGDGFTMAVYGNGNKECIIIVLEVCICLDAFL
jgi:hypothetical protein